MCVCVCDSARERENEIERERVAVCVGECECVDERNIFRPKISINVTLWMKEHLQDPLEDPGLNRDQQIKLQILCGQSSCYA